MNLDITAEEARILKEALETYISDLRMEIADTDNMDFRERLKEARDALTRIRDRL